VTALVRDDAQADRVAAIGATPAVVDLYDRPAVTSKFSSADGAIHTASPGDAASANLDSAVAGAATDAFAGTGKPYLHISGDWIYGDNTAITEDARRQRRARWTKRGRCAAPGRCGWPGGIRKTTRHARRRGRTGRPGRYPGRSSCPGRGPGTGA
jgi:hypothetical protein